MREIISERAEEIVGIQIELAIEKKDVRAIENLLDRAFGRPKQAVDHTSKGKAITLNLAGYGGVKR